MSARRPVPAAPGGTMSMRSRFARRSLFTGAGALLAGTVLAACSEPAPPPAVPSGPSLAAPTPVAGAAQLGPVIEEISAAITAADAAKDAGLLAPRIVGTAVDQRTRTYEIIGTFGDWAAQLASFPGTAADVVITSTSTEFPRSAIALVPDAGPSGVPFFVPLQQADATSPYTTWGWAQQAVGIDMPTVPADAVGTEPVALDAADLSLSPADALALYAKVLASGDASDPEDLLAANPFQTETHAQIQEERTALNAGVERDQAATIHEAYSVKDGDFIGLRTEDGGAVVMATYTSKRTVTIKDGAKVSYSEENVYTALAGTKTFTKTYVRDYSTVVGLYIPPADSDAQIQPIAATRTLLGASGS
ncbi:hypothetical protein [Brachybacterium hainanense]|uniref:DUF8094 domain-containing protein n=1 Tax=Brachybacterium hainanense TaxID=1541174 RepID=A0ABV6RBT5_9MICO